MKANNQAARKRKSALRAANSQAAPAAKRPALLPLGDAHVIFEKAAPRVVWTGEREEAGDCRPAAGKEARARIHEALSSYVARMHVRSPLCWFRELDMVMNWRHPVRDPLAVVVETCAARACTAQEYCGALVNSDTVPVLLEEALLATLRNGDTCGDVPLERLHHAALSYLQSAVGTSTCPHSALEAALEGLSKQAHASLSRVREGSSLYTSAALRGIMDRRLLRFLCDRPLFYEVPAWEPGADFTPEQAQVFSSVVQHLRRKGWAVLSGPGGSGKTHMLRQIERLCASASVQAAGDGADCPRCGEERLARKCRSCGREREVLGSRPLRLAFLGPTNRAVAVLSQVLVEKQCTCTVGTVHSMARKRDLPEQDVVVIDEASMLGTEHGDLLMRCEAFQKAALLLVGDHLQLPPVGAGELLRPLLAWSGLPALTKNLRAKSAQLAGIVQSIRDGDAVAALACERHFGTVPELMDGIAGAACDLVLCLRNEERIQYNAFEIRKRPVGNDRLVQLDDYRKTAPAWSSSSSPPPRAFVPFVGMPVRIQTNDYRPFACKGSLGYLTEVTLTGRVWRLRISVDEETFAIESTYFSIPEHIRPAYATTLHDAQGAQRKRVGIVFPPSLRCPLLSLESLYTAASRAQEELILFTCGDDLKSMQACLSKPAPLRLTPLAVLIRSEQLGSSGRRVDDRQDREPATAEVAADSARSTA
jgi:hypothetical protein